MEKATYHKLSKYLSNYEFIIKARVALSNRHKVALIAAMKRMVLIAHGVYRSKVPFTYDYGKIGREEKICV